MGAIKALIIKEFLQIRRDPLMIRIIFVVPIIQLFVLGYAITFEVQNVALVVQDSDHSQLSRLLIDKVRASGKFIIVAHEQSNERLESYFERRRAQIALVIPERFERDLASGRKPSLQVLVDGVDSNSGMVAAGYLQQIIISTGTEYTRGQSFPAPGGAVEPVVRVLYNPNLESHWYMLPGIVAILVLVTTVLLTGLGIVREREVGTLEQLSVTPITRWQLMIGKTLPFLVMGYVMMLIALAVVHFWYQVPMQGSLLLLLALAAVYIVCVLSVGLLISTLSTTQQQAVFLAFFFIIFAILTSGLFAPIHNMPEVIQDLTYLNPVRYFMEIVRGIYLKDTGLEVLWRPALALAVWAALAMSLAVLRFHKRVD